MHHAEVFNGDVPAGNAAILRERTQCTDRVYVAVWISYDPARVYVAVWISYRISEYTAAKTGGARTHIPFLLLPSLPPLLRCGGRWGVTHKTSVLTCGMSERRHGQRTLPHTLALTPSRRVF